MVLFSSISKDADGVLNVGNVHNNALAVEIADAKSNSLISQSASVSKVTGLLGGLATRFKLPIASQSGLAITGSADVDDGYRLNVASPLHTITRLARVKNSMMNLSFGTSKGTPFVEGNVSTLANICSGSNSTIQSMFKLNSKQVMTKDMGCGFRSEDLHSKLRICFLPAGELQTAVQTTVDYSKSAPEVSTVMGLGYRCDNEAQPSFVAKAVLNTIKSSSRTRDALRSLCIEKITFSSFCRPSVSLRLAAEYICTPVSRPLSEGETQVNNSRFHIMSPFVPSTLSMASAYQVNANTVLKVRANHDGRILGAVCQEITPSLNLTLGFELPTNKLNNDTLKASGLPLNYGIKISFCPQ